MAGKKGGARAVFVKDTREKQGFMWNKGAKLWNGTETKKLDYGDYSVEGYEDKIVVERKGAPSEFLSNLLTKDKDRFHKELAELAKFKFAWIVCEFSMDELFQAVFYIPANKRHYFTVEKIVGAIASIQCKYRVPILFTSSQPLRGGVRPAKILTQKLLLKAVKYIKD